MGSYLNARALEIAERREQREAQKRRRELERQAKERARLSELEQARLEVCTYENRLEVLLSVHKEQGQEWDWATTASSLPPPVPVRHSYHELRARQEAWLLRTEQQPLAESSIAQARAQDESEFLTALKTHGAEMEAWESARVLARRILAGDPKAYTQALVELSPLKELSALGSEIHFTVHSPELVEAGLKVNGTQAIPGEVKCLTVTDKLSVKAMPRVRFHELYLDYICGCILRVGREVFALLPVTTVLVTARAKDSEAPKGAQREKPVLSVALTRAAMSKLDFNNSDPSELIEGFLHRGDFKASRRTNAFAPVTPLTSGDLLGGPTAAAGYWDLLSEVRQMREELGATIAQLSSTTEAPKSEES